MQVVQSRFSNHKQGTTALFASGYNVNITESEFVHNNLVGLYLPPQSVAGKVHVSF